MLFFTFFFISTLFAVTVVAGKRKCAAANKYVQHSSGGASFTVYTGCATTGDDKQLALI
jgi:hypothetical protein